MLDALDFHTTRRTASNISISPTYAGGPRRPDPGTAGPLTFTISLPPAGQQLLGPRPAGGTPAAVKLTVQELS